ncbi:MAG TPA: ABC transporter permease [Bryobacteraceae bacterium]|nr:ABC transporter permease [Bryobacteraceae bacterium]
MNRIFNWFRLRRLEGDLNLELQYHIDRRVSDLIRSGLPEPEARRRAALELGGVTQVREEVRDMWLNRWLRDFVYDLRFSARSFLRSPSFTATAVLSLALGIGATTAIYSLVDQVVLRALPVDHPERLVLIDWNGEQLAETLGSDNLMSYPICQDLQQQKQFFDGVLCRASTTINLSTAGDPKPVAAELVSGTYFPVLGVSPALGRLLTIDDDQAPGSSPVVVLSYDFWKNQFGSAQDIVGRKVLVNRYPMTVVGVAAPAFHGIDVGEVPSLWIPAVMSAQAIPGFQTMLDRRTRWVQILGRLKQNVSLAQARTGLQPWFKAMLDEDARRTKVSRVSAERRRQFLASTLRLTAAPQGHSILRHDLSRPLWVLFVATMVLLALACLNVAGLFWARGSARHREISTRLALGASGGRVGRQLLADSVFLAVAGGLLGVVMAPITVRALIAFLPRNIAANDLQANIDTRLLLFAFLVSLAIGFLAGAAPALQACRESLVSSLRERAGTAFGGLSLRRTIVTAQIAFTLILVIAAGLFVRTLSGLLVRGPGFDTSSLISFGIRPTANGYSPADATQLIRRIHDEIRSSTSTQSSAVANFPLLLGGAWSNPLTIQSTERLITDRDVHLNAVTPGFFATLGTRIVRGRDFDERDSLPVNEGGQRVAIVNEAFVKRYFGGRNPLGAHVGMGTGPNVKPDAEIIGVVEDISYRSIRERWEQAYFPIGAQYSGSIFYVRLRGTPESAFAAMRAILRNADPTLPIAYFRTLDEQVNRTLNTERMLAALSSSFGTLALLLSLVGLYGVMSFVVTQRTREIGIRLAMGATRLSTVWLILSDALVMIAGGIAIALPCVWALGRLVESQLYGVKPTDPVTILSATLVLCSTALGAAFIPARRASAVNPTHALRFE